MPEVQPRKVQCPRCGHGFGTELTLSARTMICPECACVFDPMAGSTSGAPGSPQTSLGATSVTPAGAGGAPSLGATNISAQPSGAQAPVPGGATVVGAPRPFQPGPSSGPAARGRPSLATGLQLGCYRLGPEVGRGAMGTVHSAEDVELKREVAIKFLALELVEDPLSRERFNRECQTLARLKSHQNVVTIYAKGEWEGLPYCVMEYVDGRSVKDVLRREMKFAPARAVDVCRQAASALDFVWRQARLVHRDVKPSNLMYDREERTVKLTDFGLAKAQTNLTESGLTQSGVILGTPDYLSPEQARGERDLDFRTDVYALGATLYHLLTGQTPFPSKSVADVVAAHLHTPPPDPGALVKLPPALGALVQRMLAKQAKDRPATYDALGAELSAALTTS